MRPCPPIQDALRRGNPPLSLHRTPPRPSGTGGALLVVSQFTLYADTSSRRPGFTGAAKPDAAIPLYERFMAHCRERGFDVQHGEFGADMQVDSRNDGPVTILFDTERPL